MKAIKLVMMNHTSNLRDRNKKERKWKKADTESAHDITDPNELPGELSDSIKHPLMRSGIFIVVICWI